ncbi:hypothetical protein B6N31_18695 [Dickeya fangzhongdai]|uniref:hypothetical protein n=1 Tax=Dickeya fangzhongdai TaxID=1778540 RepID=UPI000EB45662|nr:hypothetical protein [Dickeya fangzhongdai]AYH49529.1 hypothetical protein B6N31_18695 [Dickeya fangzhongdai]
MKALLTILILIIPLNSYSTIRLTQNDDSSILNNLITKGQLSKINRIKIQKGQTFDISENGKYIGTIVPAEGYYNNIEPLCFIGWSSDNKNISDIKISIGRGFFETVTCLSLDAIRKIEVKGKTFIGFVYTVALRDRTSQNYFLLELDKERKTITDVSNTIEKLQFYSEKKSIIDLKKYLEENPQAVKS